MTKPSKDEFGDRMKEYEKHETGRKFLSMLPVYARIDGRGFSKFTKGMAKPFDLKMSEAMVETTKYLVKETGALIGYVQSDEISLVWKAPDYKSDIFFDGKVTKMTSVLAGMATAAFNREIRGWAPYEDRFPAFDARVLQLPLDYEAANMILWRAIDCRKNSVSMAAQSVISHKALQGKKRAEMLEMMAARKFDYPGMPVAFREGSFIRRVNYETTLLHGRGGSESEKPVTRSKVDVIDMPTFNLVANRTEVIFEGAAPVLREAPSEA